jgi:hypothetical protein
MTLVRAAYERPATLAPADLAPVAALCGDGALDYALVLAAFHFINRIADLLHVEPEVLPEGLRRFEPLRRLSVRLASLVMRRMDLAERPYTTSYAEAVAAITPLLDGSAEPLAPLAARPKLIEAIRLALEERDLRSGLDRATLARIHTTVEAALARRAEDADGFHARPSDPVEAFAFVGTRYAERTTPEMIAALRAAGYDDLGVLDLATAVADANQWARLHRLVGLPPGLFYVAPVAGHLGTHADAPGTERSTL